MIEQRSRKIRPILFSAPMIRALLEGRKTQTRRLLKKPAWAQDKGWPEGLMDEQDLDGRLSWFAKDTGCAAELPIPQPGDLLWVREAHRLTDDGESECVVYEVDEKDMRDHVEGIRRIQRQLDLSDIWAAPHLRKRPSIHMPRWASRLTLTVTDVRVQRLQDITEADAIAEGIERATGSITTYCDYLDEPDDPFEWFSCPVASFRTLWDSLNSDRAPWADNPWIAAYSFTVHECNVDEME